MSDRHLNVGRFGVSLLFSTRCLCLGLERCTSLYDLSNAFFFFSGLMLALYLLLEVLSLTLTLCHWNFC